MSSQLDRYKNTINYIHEHFKEKIDIDVIEGVSFYSYRNINRIFSSLHRETIGKYIKRVRLEKAAEYIKYSDHQLSDIALEVGFSDLAAFSKAFKKKFGCSPIVFRQNAEEYGRQEQGKVVWDGASVPIEFEVEIVPSFEMLFVEHRGAYEDFGAIEEAWKVFVAYCEAQNLLSSETIFFAETLDDSEISDEINCRTNLAIVLDEDEGFEPTGLFQRKRHEGQRYAKFIHIGSLDKLKDTYDLIYRAWLIDVQLEFADKPTLEFYVNHEEEISEEEFVTEIYIPVA